jgi:WD40 repeat protein
VNLYNPLTSSDVLFKFESSEDYVFDVQWNPVYSSLFASVDGEGYVDVWQLDNVEEPKIHFKTD